MPRIRLPNKFSKVLTTNARFVVLIGGRSSGKSEGIARVLLQRCQCERADVLCGREYQNSIDDSVHKNLRGLIAKLLIKGFAVTDKKIDAITGGGFRFKGFARNPENVKSAQDFKYSWIEEAQSLSQQSIDDLLPTIRAQGSQLFFTANPQSAADPFSQRFIVPYQDALDKYGFYEDDLHLIIRLNWRDNPWHGELEAQRLYDLEHMPRAKYDHIWEGAFNDDIDDPLIRPEWFDAAINAHEKLGYKAQGFRVASHDPSDLGPDDKAYAMRHGTVVESLKLSDTGNVNDGCDWATSQAIRDNVDAFIWDGDGMGMSLGRQIGAVFDGKPTQVIMFRGSQGVDNPGSIYKPVAVIINQITNKDAFRNQRAQYYFALRDRFLRTYQAVEQGQYHDPDKMLSLSQNCDNLNVLRTELCRLPVKPNYSGRFELYTKQELLTRFKLKSPNLADAVMMLFKPQTIKLGADTGRTTVRRMRRSAWR